MGTILVVEDYDDVRRMLKILLESEKFRVLEAATGTEALEVINDEHPDAILMDLALPGIDGFETIRRIRAIDGFQNTPIVVLSAYSGLSTYETALRAGSNFVMAKPIDFDDLAALLKEIFFGRKRRNSKYNRAPLRRSVLSAAFGTKPTTAARQSPELQLSL
jgi:two-component system OmpR family response regulator/two-component system phosphate regulon response regulator PhoB